MSARRPRLPTAVRDPQAPQVRLSQPAEGPQEPHLDVGVGTGYLLDHAQFPVAHPEITLLDTNPACLNMASRRIARHAPRVVQANVLDPLPAIEPFSSVGLCHLLHCVPGDIPAKAVVFDNMKAVMSPGARIFGATIVQGSAPRSWAASGCSTSPMHGASYRTCRIRSRTSKRH